MSRHVEVVERMITAVNERDIDAYLACCAPEIELHTPLADIGGVYDGPEAIRRFFADLSDTAPDFRLDIERLEPIDTYCVLAFLSVTASGRTSGIPTDTSTANVYDFGESKVKRVRIFLDRTEALAAVGLAE